MINENKTKRAITKWEQQRKVKNWYSNIEKIKHFDSVPKRFRIFGAPIIFPPIII